MQPGDAADVRSERVVKAAHLVVPPLTPFTESGTVDMVALGHNVDYVVEQCHASMVVAAGVEIQEYQYLSREERCGLIRETIDLVDGRAPVVAGISHPSFRRAIDLAHHAEKMGASVLQVLAPLRAGGGEPTASELLAYYEAIARETTLPLMLYLNASSGANPSAATTVELAGIDSVMYVKESSRDMTRVARLIAEIDDAGLASYLTTMQLLLVSLQLGGSGGTVPPPAARLASMVMAAYERGDMSQAVRLQRQFSVWPARWMHHGLGSVMKASMEILGVPTGHPYLPTSAIVGTELRQLEAYVAGTDLLSEVESSAQD